MDTIQKHKHHFNLVDLILILLLLAIVGGGLYLWFASERNLGIYPSMTYEVLISDIPSDVTLDIQKDAPVYDDITGTQIGTLSAFSVDSDGDTKDLTLTIQANGILNTDHYYQIDSYTITVGKSISLRIGTFWGEGTCRALIPGEKEA